MMKEHRLVSFTIDEPFDVSLRMLRRALVRQGLRVPCEVDTAARLKAEMGIRVKDSIVLYIDTPITLLEATLLNAAGSLYVPEPVVLTSRGNQCTVLMRSIKPLLDDELPTSVRDAILLLHEHILKAVQTVGRREVVLQRTQLHQPLPV
jgi:uncharacterized protein (DUF302 family)